MAADRNSKQLLGPFKQIVTLRNLPLKGAVGDDQLEIIRNGGAIVVAGEIEEVGDFHELINNHPDATTMKESHPGQDFVLIPGFVDAHTHICFGGSRAMDYAMRLAGKSYLEIAAAGGGIADTVRATRNASDEQLRILLDQRLERLLTEGVTTVEIKTGYGLSVQEELRLLRLLKNAQQDHFMDLVITCLAAHIKPADFDGGNIAYLRHLEEALFPAIKEEKLCSRIDIFVEQTAFSVAESRPYLLKAKEYGWSVTVHADQFSSGGAKLAVEVGAVSADHLEASTVSDMEALAGSKTVATVLPGASLGLGISFAPARKLLDAGACLAIASDWNPGSAPMGNLLTGAALLGAYEKLSIAETLAGITCRAAHALGLEDRGRVQSGCKADLQAYAVSDFREIFYHQGQIKPAIVWKKGKQYDQQYFL